MSAVVEKLQRLCAQLPYLPRTFQLIWNAARRWTLAWALLLALQALLPVAIIYLTRWVVDGLQLALPEAVAGQSLRQPLLWILLLAAVLLINEILGSILTYVRTAQAELVQDHISGLIHAQAATLDLSFYDTPAYYDRLQRAAGDTLHRPVALLENLGALAQSSLTLLAMAGVLLTFGWWVPLVLLVGMGPAVVVVVRTTLHEFGWRKRTTVEQRRASYYHWLFASHDAAAELRLFGLGEYFQQAYQTVRHKLRSERLALARTQAQAEVGAKGFALLTAALTLVWVISQAAQKTTTLGSLVMFYQAFQHGQRLTQTLLGSLAQIYSNSLFLENLFEFLALQPQVPDPLTALPMPAPLQQGIHFHNVTFHYPGSERLALDQFNLTIPAGKIVALVGENGAGKSTLIKLLCRFYDPAAGQVMLDGHDLRTFAQADLRRQITVLFQQPMRYHATAQENIAFSDLASAPTLAEIERAAQAAGADAPLGRLAQGYATMLGKWFGGAELSGGEWQRVALARAFLRQAPIIVLDEPTSALDTWAEVDWLARFRPLAQGRTVLLITHRFTTAMQADLIYVMAEGRIVESGTHSALLAQGERYATAWHQQMQAQPSRSENDD